MSKHNSSFPLCLGRSFVGLLLVCVSLLPFSAGATDPYIGYHFSTMYYNCEVVDYDGMLGQWCVAVNGLTSRGDNYTALGLPSVVTYKGNEYRVVAIGAGAFKNRTKFTYVRLGYGVRFVDASAFEGCTSLATLLLPSSLDTVGARAFANCPALKNLQCLAANPPASAADAFVGSGSKATLSLSLVSDSSMVHYCRDEVWSGFAGYKRSSEGYDYRDAGFHYVVTRRATRATPGELLLGWLSTSSAADGVLVLPSGIQTFDGLNYAVTAVADSANVGNTALTRLDLSACSEMRRIGRRAFAGCTSLTSVAVVADTLVDSAFVGCRKVTSLTLGEGTLYLGRGVFADCRSLPSLTLPASLQGMAAGALMGLPAMQSFGVAAGNTWLVSDGGVLYSPDRTTLYAVPARKGSLALPTCLRTVAGYAFTGNAAQEDIDLPYGLTTIGAHAFEQCGALRRVKVPGSVTRWGTEAFTGCTALQQLLVNLPKAPSVSRQEFAGVPSGCVLAIPGTDSNEGVNPGASYRADTVWTRRFADIVVGAYDELLPAGELGATVTGNYEHTSGNRLFAGYARIVRPLGGEASPVSRLNVPSEALVAGRLYEVEAIGDSAFAGRMALTEVTASEGIRYVQDGAFAGCAALRRVSLPMVRTLGMGAFANCSALEAVDFSGGQLTEVGDNAFVGCTSLQTLHLGGLLSRVGASAFRGSGLRELVLPCGVTSVGERAMADCASLERVQLPSSLALLGRGALNGCASLRTLMVNCAMPPAVGTDFAAGVGEVDLIVPVGAQAAYRSSAAFGSLSLRSVASGSYDLTATTADGATLGFTVTHAAIGGLGGTVALVRTDGSLLAERLPVPDAVADASGRAYAVTSLADSVCARSTALRSVRLGANVERVGVAAFNGCTNLRQADCGDAPLAELCRTAFWNTAISELTLPSTIRTLGVGSIGNCSGLRAVVCRSLHPEEMTVESGAYNDRNASDFTFYVDHRVYPGYYSLLMRSGVSCLAPYVEVQQPCMAFSCGASVSFAGTALHAFLPDALVPNADGVLPMREVKTLRSYAGAVVCGEQGDEVRLRVVPKDEAEWLEDNPLRCVTSPYTINPEWSGFGQYTFGDGHGAPYFERVREAVQLTENEDFGTSFLRVPLSVGRSMERVWLSLPDVYVVGDVDGNGVVDVADVNALVNVMLDRVSSATFDGRADVNGDGVVDVTDLNLLIDLLLS